MSAILEKNKNNNDPEIDEIWMQVTQQLSDLMKQERGDSKQQPNQQQSAGENKSQSLMPNIVSKEDAQQLSTVEQCDEWLSQHQGSEFLTKGVWVRQRKVALAGNRSKISASLSGARVQSEQKEGSSDSSIHTTGKQTCCT